MSVIKRYSTLKSVIFLVIFVKTVCPHPMDIPETTDMAFKNTLARQKRDMNASELLKKYSLISEYPKEYGFEDDDEDCNDTPKKPSHNPALTQYQISKDIVGEMIEITTKSPTFNSLLRLLEPGHRTNILVNTSGENKFGTNIIRSNTGAYTLGNVEGPTTKINIMYSPPSTTEDGFVKTLLIINNETNFENSPESKVESINATDISLQDTTESSAEVDNNSEQLTSQIIPYRNTEVIDDNSKKSFIAEDPIKPVNNTVVNGGNMTTQNAPTTNSPSSDDNETLADLSTLSLLDSGANIGQSIPIEMSKLEDRTHPAGAEIMRNISDICGAFKGKRVSFGVPTTLMEFAWSALLLYDTKELYHCGGSLITSKYVLTAAHCASQRFYQLIGVRLGEHDVAKAEQDCEELIGGDVLCTEKIDVKVENIILHHQYSHVTRKHDIALLRLEKTIDFTRSYFPICLPTPSDNRLETLREATVAGWGATEKVIRSTILIKADVPILDISKCREIYRYTKFNDSTEICGSGANEVDVCKGDSGGAMFVYESAGLSKSKFIQYGIISLGVTSCGDRRFLPAVFTKVSAYLKWIEHNLEY